MKFLTSLFLTMAILALPSCRSVDDEPSNSALQATAKHFTLKKSVHDPMEFAENSGYLAMKIAAAPIDELRSQIMSQTSLKLKSRGEAHITVLSPSEFSSLAKILGQTEINTMAKAEQIQAIEFSTLCVGSGSINKSGRRDSTFFVVVKAPQLAELRQTLLDAAKAAEGGPAPFQAAAYYPHITIGYTKNDLFEEQGVIKDESSCVGTFEETVSNDKGNEAASVGGN